MDLPLRFFTNFFLILSLKLLLLKIPTKVPCVDTFPKIMLEIIPIVLLRSKFNQSQTLWFVKSFTKVNLVDTSQSSNMQSSENVLVQKFASFFLQNVFLAGFTLRLFVTFFVNFTLKLLLLNIPTKVHYVEFFKGSCLKSIAFSLMLFQFIVLVCSHSFVKNSTNAFQSTCLKNRAWNSHEVFRFKSLLDFIHKLFIWNFCCVSFCWDSLINHFAETLLDFAFKLFFENFAWFYVQSKLDWFSPQKVVSKFVLNFTHIIILLNFAHEISIKKFTEFYWHNYFCLNLLTKFPSKILLNFTHIIIFAENCSQNFHHKFCCILLT